MFELWSAPAVCEHAGPAVDLEDRAIALPATSRAASDALLAYWLARREAGTGFRWALRRRDTGAFAGAIGFNALGARAELAYHLVPRHWGQGLAGEAAGLALAWAFASGADAVDAFVEPDNARSILLLERLGFEASEDLHEGLLHYRLRAAAATPGA